MLRHWTVKKVLRNFDSNLSLTFPECGVISDLSVLCILPPVARIALWYYFENQWPFLFLNISFFPFLCQRTHFSSSAILHSRHVNFCHFRGHDEFHPWWPHLTLMQQLPWARPCHTSASFVLEHSYLESILKKRHKKRREKWTTDSRSQHLLTCAGGSSWCSYNFPLTVSWRRLLPFHPSATYRNVSRIISWGFNTGVEGECWFQHYVELGTTRSTYDFFYIYSHRPVDQQNLTKGQGRPLSWMRTNGALLREGWKMSLRKPLPPGFCDY